MKVLLRKQNWYLFASILLVGLLLVFAYSALATGSPPVAWWVFGSGGGQSSSGNVVVNDTIGQPIIGPSNSVTVSLEAGYWLPLSSPHPLHTLYLPCINK